MITLKTVLIVVGIFLLFVAGLWRLFGVAPTDGSRSWRGIAPGWFGLALLYLSEHVAG